MLSGQWSRNHLHYTCTHALTDQIFAFTTQQTPGTAKDICDDVAGLTFVLEGDRI